MSIDNIIVKLKNIFKNDMYIINNSICLPGPESDSRVAPYFIVRFDLDVFQEFKDDDFFKNKPQIYISDLNSFKSDYRSGNTESEYIKTITDNNLVNITYGMGLYDNLNKIDEWENLNINDDIKEKLFDNNSVNIFEGKDIPKLIVGTECFPILKNNEYDNIYYYIEKDLDYFGLNNNAKKIMNIIYMTYDLGYFRVYEVISYINIDMVES